ncbi:glycosyltransferase family 39 protein [bacterium]|nr:glycosyltransferase family 39 protein [bacterium]
MKRYILGLLDSTWVKYLAAAVSLALGLGFIFGWSPLPFGPEGFDGYSGLARRIASNQDYNTFRRIWGYPGFLALCLHLFGDSPFPPLVLQSVLNAAIPVLLYNMVRDCLGKRAAGLSALLTGVLSFNTLYASTACSDSLTTVCLVGALYLIQRGRSRGGWLPFLPAGVLLGLAAQLRPNFILLPLFSLGWFLLVPGRTRRGLLRLGLAAGMAVLVCLPWVVRNYRLTGMTIPTTTLGGEQLWFGALQTGPYRRNWVYNPATFFQGSSFPYTSRNDIPSEIEVRFNPPRSDSSVRPVLEYWTDRDTLRRRIEAGVLTDSAAIFRVTAPEIPSVMYYRVDMCTAGAVGDSLLQRYDYGEGIPYLHFFERAILEDPDRHGDLLDIFDIVALTRHLCFGAELDTLRHPLDLNGDRRLDEADLSTAVSLLASSARSSEYNTVLPAGLLSVGVGEGQAVLTLADSSRLMIPSRFRGQITELQAGADLAVAVLNGALPMPYARHWVRRLQSDSTVHRLAALAGAHPRQAASGAGKGRETVKPLNFVLAPALPLENARRLRVAAEGDVDRIWLVRYYQDYSKVVCWTEFEPEEAPGEFGLFLPKYMYSSPVYLLAQRGDSTLAFPPAGQARECSFSWISWGASEVSIRFNGVYSRVEIEREKRYRTLALDYIRRHPLDYSLACLVRPFRAHLVVGSDDVFTARQFEHSRQIYLAGGILSAAILLLALAGIVIGLRSRLEVGLFLLPVVYLSLSLAPFLVTGRYTLQDQPFLFVFVSLALLRLFRMDSAVVTPGAPVADRKSGSGS